MSPLEACSVVALTCQLTLSVRAIDYPVQARPIDTGGLFAPHWNPTNSACQSSSFTNSRAKFRLRPDMHDHEPLVPAFEPRPTDHLSLLSEEVVRRPGRLSMTQPRPSRGSGVAMRSAAIPLLVVIVYFWPSRTEEESSSVPFSSLYQWAQSGSADCQKKQLSLPHAQDSNAHRVGHGRNSIHSDPAR